MKEMFGYVGSGKSTFLNKLETNDIKHINVGFNVRIIYIFLFLLFRPNKLIFVFLFKSKKNSYIYMYLIGLKFYEKYSKNTFFLDQGFAQLLASELYVCRTLPNILYDELIILAGQAEIYFVNISKNISFERFKKRKSNRSRVILEKDWLKYSEKTDKVLKIIKVKNVT
jgi:hypothetical protein